ncbi:Ig-like domain-containing protein [Pyxidicoccus sp. 3LFB2]
MYDPATETWTSTGSLATARVGHAGTVLTDGRVLVVGGRNGAGTFLASAERYDPGSGTWSSAGNMSVVRDRTTATLLLSGDVLVAGGRQDMSDNQHGTLELYVPATHSWTTLPVRLATPRFGHTATLLPSGKVLLQGGTSGSYLQSPTTSAEYFNPDGARDSWRPSVSLPVVIGSGGAFTVSGARLRGISEGSHGHYGSSPTDFPRVQLMPVGGGAITRLSTSDFSNTSLSTVAPTLSPGPYLLSVTVGGITGGRVVGGDTGTLQAQDQSVTTAEDTSVAVTLSAQNSAGRPITWSVRTPPARGTLSGTAPQLTYKPAAHFFGNDSFAYLASDGVSAAVVTVSVTVTPVNDAPVARILSVPVMKDTPVAVTLSVTDPDGDAVTYQVKSAPTRGTLSGTPPNLTYTPQAGYLGTDSFTYTGSDGTLESNLGRVLLTVSTTPINAAAVYDSALKVPRCASTASSCDSFSLLYGRAQLGPEVNHPNTLGGTCADGTSGKYLSDESLQQLKVSTLYGQPFTPHTEVRIEATVWARSAGAGAQLDLYYSASATNPNWVFIATITPVVSGIQWLVTNYKLPAQPGSHAIRGRFRSGGSASGPCVPGPFTDHDDLVFHVDPTVDLTPPTVSLTWPLPNDYVSDTITVRASATDNLGVTKVEFYDGATLLGTDSTAPYAVTWNTHPAKNGQHTVSARAYDAAGNVGTASVTVTVHNDLQPPGVIFQAPGAGAHLRGRVSLQAHAYDLGGVVWVRFYDGNTLLGADYSPPYSWDWDTLAAADGAHTLRAEAEDWSFNVGTSLLVPVTVDNAAPTTALTAPADGATVRNTVTLTATALDRVGVTRVEFFADGVLLGSDSTAPYSWDWDSNTVDNGAHVLGARAHDRAGNEGAVVSVSVVTDNDRTPPQVRIAAPLAGATVRGNVAITASASDNVGVTRLEFYNGAQLVGSASNTVASTVWWSSRAVPNGTYTLRVLARDARDNVAEASVVVTVDNELTPPTLSFTSPLAGTTVTGTLRLSVSASDDTAVASVVYEVDSQGIGSSSRPPFLLGWDSRQLPDGLHTVTATAFDTSGNASEPAILTVFVDNAGSASLASTGASIIR